MFKILLIITLIVAIFCLYVAIVTLFAMSRENELPDIEDVEFS
jgi:flagellar basal body-associated protein FliL